MPGVLGTALNIHRDWLEDDDLKRRLFVGARASLTYDLHGRATRYAYVEDEQDWPVYLKEEGPQILAMVNEYLKMDFPIVALQGYRYHYSWTDWHSDMPFDEQAILSLGAGRDLGLRQPGGDEHMIRLFSGDLVHMPSGFQRDWEHCVPQDIDKTGERISFVFRTKA
jgi:hypothetical protein